MHLVKVLIFIFVVVKSTNQEPLLWMPFLNKPTHLEPSEEENGTNETPKSVEVKLSALEEAALTSISSGYKEFAVKLYCFVAEKPGSVILSPMSLEMVLALALAGAKGVTATELSTLLSLPETVDETVLIGLRSLIQVIQNPVLNFASRMFLEKSAPVKDDYQKIAKKYFLSPTESLDFNSDSEGSREHINLWVERQTNYKIKDLLATDTISKNTRLVLVNALHFNAIWKIKFDESKTKEQPFFLSSTEMYQVQMMNSKSTFHFFYDAELKAKILRLDYEGGVFEMCIILPNESEGLNDLEAKLENITIFERIEKTTLTTVDVHLPQFKIEKTIEMNDVLKSMGAPTMFSPSADFRGISDEALTVSSVIHKGFVEVNEKGTEAAAATAVIVMRTTSLGSEPPREEEFKANHPFMFIISHKEYQLPCFFGRYEGPK